MEQENYLIIALVLVMFLISGIFATYKTITFYDECDSLFGEENWGITNIYASGFKDEDFYYDWTGIACYRKIQEVNQK